MQVVIMAVGALKSGPEKAIADQYAKRITWRLKTIELKDLSPALLPDEPFIIGLDEKGDDLTSEEFAQLIAQQQMMGTKSLNFIIGGANGLSIEVRHRCDKLLCLGRMTWPHLLVRGLLLEQLYRAQQILAGHPYHRP